MRTCVGCRTSGAADQFVRLSVSDGCVRPRAAGAVGRSAYLCPRLDCLERAEKRKAFGRAFRCQAVPDQEFRERFTELCEQRERR